jgi:O-antigen ligase
MKSSEFKINFFWDKYTLASLCLLAFCVSLGTATVSLSKALVLLGFFAYLVLNYKYLFEFISSRTYLIFFWMFAAVMWMLISMTWSQAEELNQWKYFYAHKRFLWVAIIFFQIRTRERGLTVLKWLIFGQIFVLCVSWLLWLGVKVPFTRSEIQTEKGIAFTSTLEQPVMLVLVLVVIWNFRDYFSKQWGIWFVRLVILAAAINLVFVMTGRSGYIVFLVVVGHQIYKKLPYRLRWVALMSPCILCAIFYVASPVFHKRISEITTNTGIYFKKESPSNHVTTSEEERLDMWRTTALGIVKRPILGYGVGSMPGLFRGEYEIIKTTVSQPHQQYLFWWTEFGLVGLMIMLGFFLALIKDSGKLDSEAKFSLQSVLLVLFVMGMFNCPFFGVGMGEFFFLEIATLLAIKNETTPIDRN